MPLYNTFEFDVDIKKQVYFKEPAVTQYDSVQFIINVFDNDADLDLSNVQTVALANTRADGVTILTNGEVTSSNQITVKLGDTEMSVVGKVKAVVQLYDVDGRVSTMGFTYNVIADPTAEGYTPSEEERTLIEVVLGDGPLAIQQAIEAANAANTAAGNANQAAQNVETKIEEMDGKIEETNTAINNTNTAITNAETATQSANEAAANASSAAENANAKAAYAQQQGDYAKAQGDAIKDILEQGTVASVNGKTGAVVLTAADVDAYTKAETDAQIANLVDSAPETLDTLNELAQALGEDPNFAATVAAEIGSKIDKSEKGVAGGVAKLNEQGQVVDANGNLVEGKVKSVNNVEPDVNGNISIAIPDTNNLATKQEVQTVSDNLASHQAETASKFTNLNLNVIDMAVELETLKGATLNGVTANIFVETFTNLNDINLMNGVYDSVNKRLVL